MIYVTGDIHGEVDIHRLNSRQFLEQRHMDKGDYVIICGDFGCVWAGGQTDRYWLNWLEAKPFTTLFVDGNHENFPLLEAYPQRAWQGGQVHELRPSVLHLMRGQVFRLEGRRFFTMGGASSHDRAYRLEGKSWWPEELPSDGEMAGALANLEGAGWQVDYVITHCAPDLVQHVIDPSFASDRLTNFLRYVDENLHFRHWYFGHYHVDRRIDRRHTALYDWILPLTEEEDNADQAE